MKRYICILTALLCCMTVIFAGCSSSDDIPTTHTQATSEIEQTETSQGSADGGTQETQGTDKISNEKPVHLYVMDYTNDTAEHESTLAVEWTDDDDMATFGAFVQDTDTIAFTDEIALHQEDWDSIAAESEYRIGYEISFDVGSDHKVITILKPQDIEDSTDLFMGDVDTDDVTGYLGVWLYDDYHQEGGWYSHVTSDEYNDETLLTSIKLRLTPQSDEMSNLKLKVFSYSSSLEFDSDGHYNNVYGEEISITKK